MTRPDSIPTRDSLLSRLKDWDDNESWRDFFNTYWRLIYSTAVRLGLNDSEAQEVVQETVVSVAKKIKDFKYDPATARFKTWLNLIIRRRVIDRQRKRGRQPETVPLEGADAEGFELADILADPASLEADARWEEDWQRNLIAAAMTRVQGRVSPKHFLIYQSCVVEGRSVSETARDLGVSAPAIYLARHRVGRMVRNEIRQLDQGIL